MHPVAPQNRPSAPPTATGLTPPTQPQPPQLPPTQPGAWGAPTPWVAPSDPTAASGPGTAPVPPVGPPPAPPAGPPVAGGVPGPAAPIGGSGGDEPRPGRTSGLRAALIGGLVGAVVAAGATTVAMWDRGAEGGGAPSAATTLTNSPASQLSGEELDIRGVLDKVRPSVVSIHTGTRQGEAAGSGIVLSEEGLVLTNAHVIEGADSIEVDFSNGQTAEARVVGSVPEADVALVQAEGLDGTVQPAELGSSADLVVGDEVVAIGNALNLGAEPSVTTGIVSQTGRSIIAPDGSVLDDLIQTDAAINPGNSGGPLVNAAGQVVGVNTAILADAQNIGFALEIDSIRPLIEDLKAGRDARKSRPLLGVSTLDVARIDAELAERFGVTATAGAFVQEVSEGSGAAVAGIEVGDVIVSVDGRRVRNSEDVGQAVRAKEAGEEIVVVVERAGQTTELTATLGDG